MKKMWRRRCVHRSRFTTAANHLKALSGLFAQVLRMVLKLDRVAIKGSKHKAMIYRRMQEEQKRLR